VWDVFHSGIGEVAAGHLPCAFEQVAGKRCEPDARPIVGGPTERRENRRHEQRRIGHPPGDHDVGTASDRVEAWFDEPASAVTPGQAAVFYRGDEVLGGGWIAEAL